MGILFQILDTSYTLSWMQSIKPLTDNGTSLLALLAEIGAMMTQVFGPIVGMATLVLLYVPLAIAVHQCLDNSIQQLQNDPLFKRYGGMPGGSVLASVCQLLYWEGTSRLPSAPGHHSDRGPVIHFLIRSGQKLVDLDIGWRVKRSRGCCGDRYMLDSREGIGWELVETGKVCASLSR